MNHLSRNDYAGALALLARVEASVASVGSFAHETVAAVGEFVAADVTTLCACGLVDGPRAVIGLPGGRSRCEVIARFDRRPFARRMARHHGPSRLADAGQLSGLLDGRLLHRCAPYVDDFGRVGFEYTISAPLLTESRTLIAVVLSRRDLDFAARDRERLELLRPHLAHLFQQACRADGGRRDSAPPPGSALREREPESLTPRERDVMHWLAAGKTDAEIAALLSLSPRTVSKHLEHIYVKLGVETRTAAVMRVLAMQPTR